MPAVETRDWRGGLAKRSAGHDQRLRAACQLLVQYLPSLSFLSLVWTNTTLQLALCERDSSSLSHRGIDNLLLFVFLLLFLLFLFFCPSSTPTPSFFVQCFFSSYSDLYSWLYDQFNSVQYSVYAFGKACMRPTPSLRSFPNVAFETVPMFV